MTAYDGAVLVVTGIEFGDVAAHAVLEDRFGGRFVNTR
jgi:hypothetical protein